MSDIAEPEPTYTLVSTQFLLNVQEALAPLIEATGRHRAELEQLGLPVEAVNIMVFQYYQLMRNEILRMVGVNVD